MHQLLSHLQTWKPESGRVIRTIDAHAAGEPLRIVTDGFPKIVGDTILEKRRFALQHHERASKGTNVGATRALRYVRVSDC